MASRVSNGQSRAKHTLFKYGKNLPLTHWPWKITLKRSACHFPKHTHTHTYIYIYIPRLYVIYDIYVSASDGNSPLVEGMAWQGTCYGMDQCWTSHICNMAVHGHRELNCFCYWHRCFIRRTKAKEKHSKERPIMWYFIQSGCNWHHFSIDKTWNHTSH